MEFTYAMLLQFLTEAEQRVKTYAGTEVAARSQETVDLCNQRLANEQITRKQLEALARSHPRHGRIA